jgi:hypothetical protein
MFFLPGFSKEFLHQFFIGNAAVEGGVTDYGDHMIGLDGMLAQRNGSRQFAVTASPSGDVGVAGGRQRRSNTADKTSLARAV